LDLVEKANRFSAPMSIEEAMKIYLGEEKLRIDLGI
jgi:hypothetical protein